MEAALVMLGAVTQRPSWGQGYPRKRLGDRQEQLRSGTVSPLTAIHRF